MIEVKITHTGKDSQQWLQETLLKVKQLEPILSSLANECAEDMKDEINSSRKNPKRPDDKLINAITAEKISDMEWGIGNIGKLMAEAPYFELINDGGSYVTKETHVVPTTYFAGAETPFVTFKAGSQHTIEPVRYVEIAGEMLKRNIKDQLSTILK